MKAQRKYSQEKVTTGVQGVTSGQKESKRAKKAFLDHIIDQKRLIKGFRLEISKIKSQKKKHNANTARKKSLQGFMGSQVANKGQKGSKRPSERFFHHISDVIQRHMQTSNE